MDAGAQIKDPPGEPPPRGDASGLVRKRLTSRLLDPGAYLVARVVAPAGSGKSRLLAHVAVSYPGPVAWCGAPEPVPRTEQALAQWLWNGVGPALSADGPPPIDIAGVVDSLTAPGRPVLVMADDLHLLEGSDAELALADLIRGLPGRMRLLVASRVNLALDLSRLRVSGQLVEIGPDDLRFRAWEVEELFRDVYRDPLIPEEVATLAHRTAGWAAYLQLFHLATARRPLAERRRVLASLTNRSRLVQEYLTRHVLSGLSADLQDFLIRTSVLRRPSVPLCDELLGWSQGSRELLAELERRQLFTDRLDDDSYRYHTVLLSYLEARLVEAIGGAAAREEHRRAAVLLERDGLTEDATAAFAKAEDWEGVARTLGHPAGAGSGLGGAWLEALPPTVVETDALLLMARARRALASGALADTVATMKAAEEVAASSLVAERCRQERDRVAVWVSPERPGGTDWCAVLRGATQRQPREALRLAGSLPGPSGRFAEGAAAFLAGEMATAARLLRGVASHPGAAPAMAAGAHLMATVSASMTGRQPEEGELDRLRDEVEEAGIPWLDRMSRAALVLFGPLSPGRPGQSRRRLPTRRRCLGRSPGGVAERALPSAPPGGWCPLLRAGRGVVCQAGGRGPGDRRPWLSGPGRRRGGDAEMAARSAKQVRTVAALLDVPGAAGVAALALARLLGDDRELGRARALLEPLGTWEWHQRLGVDPPAELEGAAAEQPWSAPAGPPQPEDGIDRNGQTAAAAVRGPAVQLRCLGGFSLVVRGRTLDESAAKPMERALLHLLCMRAGEQIHREALIEALWPEAERDAGLHRLQVAISSLRRLVAVDAGGSAAEPGPGRGFLPSGRPGGRRRGRVAGGRPPAPGRAGSQYRSVPPGGGVANWRPVCLWRPAAAR